MLIDVDLRLRFQTTKISFEANIWLGKKYLYFTSLGGLTRCLDKAMLHTTKKRRFDSRFRVCYNSSQVQIINKNTQS